ncbi:transmembrane protein 45A-like [Nannospalax galili]|uniref:transmembrane protein 45A-like n=1 Tax=Nannospalax galili TaxID=1026970 RepID=UPI0004ED0763|nr:transmembrane protein 45A-like [Nannospalax galili]
MNDSEDTNGLKLSKPTGDFEGHALPGSFLLILGLWWSSLSILKFVCKQKKETFYLGSKALIHRAKFLEGIVLVGMVITGISGLQIFADSSEIQFLRILRLHHITIYIFFGLLGVANILCATISSLPASLIKLMLSNAFFVQTFIFYNHTHGRDTVDIFLHKLLGLAAFLAGLVSFMEVLTKNNAILELLRSSLIILQGSWLWQLGFILYNPTGGPAWDLKDRNNNMLLSIYFCWHYAFTFIIIGVNYAVITWLVKWRLRKLCLAEVTLLKNAEREQESGDEM